MKTSKTLLAIMMAIMMLTVSCGGSSSPPPADPPIAGPPIADPPNDPPVDDPPIADPPNDPPVDDPPIDDPPNDPPVDDPPDPDSDGDGISDTIDLCPGTPPYTNVDSEGCEDYSQISWVPVNDPGFVGQVAQHETTNFQFARYLQEALIAGKIKIVGNIVYASNDDTLPHATIGDKIIFDGTIIFTCNPTYINHPVVNVSWYGAMAFAEFYDSYIPTAKQWRAIADYNGSFIYGCGLTVDETLANYDSTGTEEVGSYGVFGYGICDMAGNVSEWVSDLDEWDGTMYLGGNWWDVSASALKISTTDHSGKTSMWNRVGFRVIR